MEKEKNGSVFTSILAIVVIVGIVIFYLTKEKNNITETENMPQESMQEEQLPSELEQNQISTDATLETEIQNFDTGFEDMNIEDLDI